MGLDAESTLQVSDLQVTFKSSSLFGQVHQVVPLASIASTHCGCTRPLGALLLGVVFLLGAQRSREPRSGSGNPAHRGEPGHDEVTPRRPHRS